MVAKFVKLIVYLSCMKLLSLGKVLVDVSPPDLLGDKSYVLLS